MRILLSIAFVFAFLLCSSQPDADTSSRTFMDPWGVKESPVKRKVRFNMEFGTTFGASSYGNYFGSYVSPNFSYPLSDRFLLSAGGYFSGMHPGVLGGPEAAFGYPYSTLLTRSFVYVSGAYRLTDNLTVRGTAYREISPFGPANLPPGLSPEARGLIMGVDYRIGDHILIRGEVEVREGNHPFYTDPFMHPAGRRMYDPFFYGP